MTFDREEAARMDEESVIGQEGDVSEIQGCVDDGHCFVV
jgi:hypothetical protein